VIHVFCLHCRIVTIRKQDPPWFHNEIMLTLRQRRRAYNSAKRSNSIHRWPKYVSLRNKLNWLKGKPPGSIACTRKQKLTFLSEEQNKTTLINLPQNLIPPITALTFGKQRWSSPLYPRHLITYLPYYSMATSMSSIMIQQIYLTTTFNPKPYYRPTTT